MSPAAPASFERVPPQDLAAETVCARAMMLTMATPSPMPLSACASDFYTRLIGVVYRIVLTCTSGESLLDAITVSVCGLREPRRIRGAPYHTCGLLRRRPPMPSDMLPDVRDASMRLCIRRSRFASRQTGFSGEGEVEDSINRAQAEVQRITAHDRGGLRPAVRLPRRCVHRTGIHPEPTLSRYPHRLHRPWTSSPTGCIQADDRGGGIVPRWESPPSAWTARPCIKHGLTSAIFSLEMSRNEIVMRPLSAKGNCRCITCGPVPQRATTGTRMVNTMSTVSDAPLFIDDSPNMSMMEIRAKCRRPKQQHDLRLIIVDYLQLMSSGKRVESRQQEVG